MAWPTTTVTAGDEADLRTKLTNAAAGDSVYMPGSTYALTQPIVVRRGINVFGDGQATNITVAGAFDAFQLDTTSFGAFQRMRFSDFRVTGNRTGLGAGNAGQAFKLIQPPDVISSRLVFERLGVAGFTNGINIDATQTIGGVGGKIGLVWCRVTDCEVTGHANRGVFLTNISMAKLDHTEINSCGSGGLLAIACNAGFNVNHCAVEGNNLLLGSAREGDSQVCIKLCHGFVVNSLDVEFMPTAAGANKTALCISNCVTGTVRGFTPGQTAFQAESKAIDMLFGCRGIQLDPFPYSFITKYAFWDPDCAPPIWNEEIGAIRFAPHALS